MNALSSLTRIVALFMLVQLAACVTATPEIYLKIGGEVKMELTRPAYGISALSVSKDGHYLITGDNGGSIIAGSGSIMVWDLLQGTQTLRKKDPAEIMTAVAVSPDNRRAVSIGMQGARVTSLSLWDLSTGTLLNNITEYDDLASAIRFSADGRQFLTSNGADILIFDAPSGALSRRIPTKGDTSILKGQLTVPNLMAIYTPDGKRILTGGIDGYVRLFDTATGKELWNIKAHGTSSFSGGVSGVAMTPDGKYIVTSGYADPDVKVWDAATRKEVRRLSGFESVFLNYVLGIDLSPDGRHLFITGMPPKTWDVLTGETADASYILDMWKGAQMVSVNPATIIYHPDGKDLLITLNDAAVRQVNAITGEEKLMMVSFADGEWVAITSQGYYNASENGAKHLLVKVGGKRYAVDRFYDVFYRPDIVAATLHGEDTKSLTGITMEDAIKMPPPLVEFNGKPAEKGDKVTVCYQAKDAGGGIGEVRLFHNGKLIRSDGYYREAVERGTEKLQAMNSAAIYEQMRGVVIKAKNGNSSPITHHAKGKLFDECAELEPVAGENEVSVASFNGTNTVQSDLKTVRFVSKREPPDPHLYILAIGIDHYRDNSVTLKFAHKDAADITNRLAEKASTLYKADNIHTLLLADDRATKENILKNIDDLSARIRPGDGFIFFVAGHGILMQNQYYMLTHDYAGAVNDNVAISANEIVEMSKKLRSLSQLYIFDTCHAGGVDYIVSGLYDARMSVLAKKMGLHIYASANSLQGAIDGYEGNGLFSHTLLEGLSGDRDADADSNGIISLTELGEYSKSRTVELSKKIGHLQTPLIVNFGKDSSIYTLDR